MVPGVLADVPPHLPLPQVSPTRRPRLPSAGMWVSRPPSPASLSGSRTTRGKYPLDAEATRALCIVTSMPRHWLASPPSCWGTGLGTAWRCKQQLPSTGTTSAARPETGTSASLVSAWEPSLTFLGCQAPGVPVPGSARSILCFQPCPDLWVLPGLGNTDSAHPVAAQEHISLWQQDP